jgi:hypothetical protein
VTNTVQEKLDQYPIFDDALVGHGFTSYMRDYDVITEFSAAYNTAYGGVSYPAGSYRYRFTHCVVAEVTTTVSAEVWRVSWTDEYTNSQRWEDAGAPEGYLWGVEYALAYPGLIYEADAPRAKNWAQRLGKSMHEIVIKTNAYDIRLIFHDVVITQIAQGDPLTRTLTPL